MKPSPVKSTIDFEQDGLQHGFLKLPHSHDESAYGSVMIPSIHLDMPDQRCYIGSESNLLLEMKVDLGEKVQEGQLLAVIHDHHRIGTEPVPYHSQLDGIFTTRHVPGLIGLGDTLAIVATVTASP